jgi:hypothetical protein
MIKKQIYFLKVTPFRFVEKKGNTAWIISDKGIYKTINSALLTDFKEGDFLYKSVLIGEDSVYVKYFKMDDERLRGHRRLENLFFGFEATSLFSKS